MTDFPVYRYGTEGMEGKVVMAIEPHMAAFIAGWIEAKIEGTHAPFIADFALNLVNADTYRGEQDA